MTALEQADDVTAALRPRYRESQVLTLADLTDEQAARIQAARRHLLTQHGWGVTGGFRVTATPGGAGVEVAPGEAVDGFGRRLLLRERWILRWNGLDPEAETLDLWLCATETRATGRIFEKTVVAWTRVDRDPARPDAPAIEDAGLADDKAPPWPVYLGRYTRETSDDTTDMAANPKVDDERLVGQSVVAAGGGRITLGTEVTDPAVGVAVTGRQRLTVRHGGSRLTADTTVTGSVSLPSPGEAVTWLAPVSGPEQPRPWAMYRHRTPARPADPTTPARPELNDLRLEIPATDGLSPSSGSVVMRPVRDQATEPPMTVSADGTVRMRILRPGRVLVAAARADTSDPRFRQAVEDAWIDEIVRISDRIYQRFGPDPGHPAPLQVATADLAAGEPRAGSSVTPQAMIRNTGTADVNGVRVVRSIQLGGAPPAAPQAVATVSRLLGGQAETIDQPAYSIPDTAGGGTLILTLSAVGLRPGGDVVWGVQTRSWTVLAAEPGPGGGNPA
jgi:hypothetical protein